ncbi:MAG: 3-hydroxyacyl-CoA dehydrogenase, partial [Chloroflexi bacterium]|nr:3-hydroxyacyl-CoA dehydrogenase [Chloroflexota bacterium]
MAVEQVAIFGAGTMGAGIAQVALTHGCTVRLIDTQPGAVERARESVGARLQRQVDRGAMSAEEHAAVLARLVEGSIDDLAGVELVVEAVIEDLEAKQALFAQLDAAAPADAVLATNTSSLAVGEIASPLRNPSRVVGMHFFNPAPVMALVEVVAAEATSDAAADLVAETASAWGKVPARTKDAPGFIVNRVARSSYVEAFRMLDEGVGGPDTIDGAMRKLGQFRMGPMQVADLVGLEVNYAVTVS